MEFDPNRPGHAAIGITTRRPGTNDLQLPWDAVVVSLAQSPASGANRIGIAIWTPRMWKDTNGLVSQRVKSIALVEMDVTRRLMCIDSEGNEEEPIRRTIVPVPLPSAGPELIQMPCVHLSGAVTATILPWPHSRLAPSDTLIDSVYAELLVPDMGTTLDTSDM
jgi:hypothetical protein